MLQAERRLKVPFTVQDLALEECPYISEVCNVGISHQHSTH
jgi:hypothetical protein